MVEAFGVEAGTTAAAYSIACRYRREVKNELNHFPHLHIHGRPGKGKSFLACSISAFLGIERGENLHSYNPARMNVLPALLRNGYSKIIFLDDLYCVNEVDAAAINGFESGFLLASEISPEDLYLLAPMRSIVIDLNRNLRAPYQRSFVLDHFMEYLPDTSGWLDEYDEAIKNNLSLLGQLSSDIQHRHWAIIRLILDAMPDVFSEESHLFVNDFLKSISNLKKEVGHE